MFFKANSLVFARVILHKHNFALLIKYCTFANYYVSEGEFLSAWETDCCFFSSEMVGNFVCGVQVVVRDFFRLD